jgi:hypothetical protein
MYVQMLLKVFRWYGHTLTLALALYILYPPSIFHLAILLSSPTTLPSSLRDYAYNTAPQRESRYVSSRQTPQHQIKVKSDQINPNHNTHITHRCTINTPHYQHTSISFSTSLQISTGSFRAPTYCCLHPHQTAPRLRHLIPHPAWLANRSNFDYAP